MATKKKTEAAEEAKKAAQAAQNDAQSVETTEGGKNTPQKKHPAKRQIQSPQRDRQTPQQKPRRRIPQSNHPNPKAKFSASTRSTTSSFPATWIPARSSRASAGGSRTTDVPTGL